MFHAFSLSLYLVKHLTRFFSALAATLGLLISLGIGTYTSCFPSFDLFWIQSVLTAIFIEFCHRHWGGLKNNAEFFLVTPLVRNG